VWIASKYGFFSVILKEGSYHIRARVEGDLGQLLKDTNVEGLAKVRVHETRDADYRFRVVLPEGSPVYAAIMNTLVTSIDYPNFKGHIAGSPTQQHKLHAYHQIWDIMYGVQEARTKRGPYAARW